MWKYAQADFERANELLSDVAVDDLENNIDLAWSKWIHGCNERVHPCQKHVNQTQYPMAFRRPEKSDTKTGLQACEEIRKS